MSILVTAVLLLVGLVLSRQIVRGIRSTQAELVDSEARFRHVFESNIVGIVFWNADGGIVDANAAFLDAIGYERSDLSRLNWRALTPEEFKDADAAAEALIRRDGVCPPYEKAFYHRDGSTVPVVLGAALSSLGSEDGVCFVLDVSEQRALKHQLQQAQKLEAVGPLVGGIAHDFNNTLAAMYGNLYLAQQSNRDPRVAEHLEGLVKLSEHSANIVQQLMAFARKDFVRMQPCSLNGFLTELHQLMAAIIPENIQFQLSLPQQDIVVRCDETQMQQILLNLLNNARDALEGIPQPMIECSLGRTSSSLVTNWQGSAGESDLAHITVRDNGKGLSAKVLSHIFEPFYTTKEVGTGSGLGMSMVYGAMQSHRGQIGIDSVPGEGTTVHLYLPVVDVEHTIQEEVTGVSARSPEKATILLVDDNEGIREVGSEFLRAEGYAVHVAVDGADALDVFVRLRESDQVLDVVITDLVMPKLGGVKLVQTLREFCPRLPAIFITGYDQERSLVPETVRQNSESMAKPFSYRELSDLARGFIELAQAERQGKRRV